MIIELFILFTALAFILAIVGYLIDNELMMIFGFLIIGLMSIPLLDDQLEYRTGTNITTEYNYTGTVLTTTNDIVIREYEPLNSTTWYGIFFIFICFGGFYTLFKGYGRGSDEDD